MLAVSGEVHFGRPGGYVVRSSIGDDEGGSARTVSFRVHFPQPVVPPVSGPADSGSVRVVTTARMDA